MGLDLPGMEFTGYIFEGNFEKNNTDRTDEMIRESVEKYCTLHGLNVPAGDIVRLENGKPYIEGSPVEFNVSHSGEMAIVVVGEAPCGVDLQVMEVRNHKAIAKKLFTQNEQDFVEKYGLEGFFRVWVHREAFGKLIGDGLFGAMPEFIDEKGFPKIEVSSGEGENLRKAYIRDIPVAPDIFLAFATFGEDDTLEFSI